jgi:glutathione S-transferase
LNGIHPLGKSPILTIQPEAAPEPLVLAESSLITEYLTGHFGKWLAPKQYIEEKEGQVGGETICGHHINVRWATERESHSRFVVCHWVRRQQKASPDRWNNVVCSVRVSNTHTVFSGKI